MHRPSRNRSHLSNTEDVASVAVASRQATSINNASRDPQGTPQQRDPPNVVLIKRTTHKTVRTEKTVTIEEFAPVPAQTGEPDSTTLRTSSRTSTSATQTPTKSTPQRSSTVITSAATDLSTDSSESDSSPVPVQRLRLDSLADLSPLLARERPLLQSPSLDQGSTLDLDTKVKAWKGKAKISPPNPGGMPKKPRRYLIPNPSELQKFDAPHYYLVTVGQVVGIFADWNFVSAITQGVSCASQSKYLTWREAFRAYERAFHGGWVKRKVLTGSSFDDGFDDDDVRSDGTFLNELEAGPSHIRK